MLKERISSGAGEAAAQFDLQSKIARADVLSACRGLMFVMLVMLVMLVILTSITGDIE